MIETLQVEKSFIVDLRQKMTGLGNQSVTNLLAIQIPLPGIDDSLTFIINAIKSQTTQNLREKIPQWLKLKDGTSLSYDDVLAVQKRFQKMQNSQDDVKLKSFDVPVAQFLGLIDDKNSTIKSKIHQDLCFKPDILFKNAITNHLSSFLDIKMMGIVMEQSFIEAGKKNEMNSEDLAQREKKYHQRLEDFAATMLLLKESNSRSELAPSFKILYNVYKNKFEEESKSIHQINQIEASILKLMENPNENVKKMMRKADPISFAQNHPIDENLFIQREESIFKIQLR